MCVYKTFCLRFEVWLHAEGLGGPEGGGGVIRVGAGEM